MTGALLEWASGGYNECEADESGVGTQGWVMNAASKTTCSFTRCGAELYLDSSTPTETAYGGQYASEVNSNIASARHHTGSFVTFWELT